MQLKFYKQDGFIFELLHFLWLKDPIKKKTPSLNIPFTILFLSGQPKFWYFSQSQTILRKTKEKLDPEHLKNVFYSEDSQKVEASWIYEENGKLKFNYLTSKEVSEFIGKLDFKADGVLQGFIPAKGEYTTTIKCIWQKNYCVFEQIRNLNKINKRNLTPSQKIQTFESDGGPTISSTLNSNALSKVLEDLCHEIVQHISNVTFEKINITLMELYFRQSENGQIYLLFCSKVRTQQQQTKCLSEMRFSLKVPLAKGPNRIETINQRCVGCKIIQNVNLFEDITIGEIIESWDRFHEIKYKQEPPLIQIDKNCLIPKIIRFLYPNLNFQHYQALKSNLAFTKQKISLCLKCYKGLKDNNSHFHTATYSIQNRILQRQRSTQSTVQYDTQSIKKSQKSQESIGMQTECQTKSSSQHRRSISTTAYALKFRCSTLFNFNNSISQIFKNEQSQS